MNRSISILIVEASEIIVEGFRAVLSKTGITHSLVWVSGIDEMQQSFLRRKCEIILINPSLIQPNPKDFLSFRSKFDGAHWIGLIYAYYDQHVLSNFDATVSVSDSAEKITAVINSLLNSKKDKDAGYAPDVLSDREIDVLRLLTSGLMNKEIADKLNISIHTVITHRKNISQKTGIKSVSGLTIYAVVKKLISLDSLPDLTD